MKRPGILLLVLLAAVPAFASRRRAYDAPSGCSMTVSPRTIAFPADGGSAIVTVVPTGTCTWVATTGAGWLTLSRGGNAVGVQVGPNDGAARTAVVDVGGHVITVTQGAREVIVSPPAGNLIANG
ncbi:MAG TPA: BACON domain-containing protein, partial [Thermoanaerobaculia bacterium]